jgi:adenine-specific DNA-methyltransferase
VRLLASLIEQSTTDDDIILDFFAGSGTTAHAVMDQNVADNCRRQSIVVQLPETLDPTDRDQKTASDFCDRIGKPRTIAELTKERIRRAGAKIKKESLLAQNLDVGFRVLKVDSSNMQDIYYRPDEVRQEGLLDAVDNIRPDRTAEDLLFHVLIDWGVDLTLPVRREPFEGKTVYFVDGDALAACFERDVTEELVKEIAARRPLRAVFRDSGFVSDAVKINAEQIFKLLSPVTEVKVI